MSCSLSCFFFVHPIKRIKGANCFDAIQALALALGLPEEGVRRELVEFLLENYRQLDVKPVYEVHKEFKQRLEKEEEQKHVLFMGPIAEGVPQDVHFVAVKLAKMPKTSKGNFSARDALVVDLARLCFNCSLFIVSLLDDMSNTDGGVLVLRSSNRPHSYNILHARSEEPQPQPQHEETTNSSESALAPTLGGNARIEKKANTKRGKGELGDGGQMNADEKTKKETKKANGKRSVGELGDEGGGQKKADKTKKKATGKRGKGELGSKDGGQMNKKADEKTKNADSKRSKGDEVGDEEGGQKKTGGDGALHLPTVDKNLLMDQICKMPPCELGRVVQIVADARLHCEEFFEGQEVNLHFDQLPEETLRKLQELVSTCRASVPVAEEVQIVDDEESSPAEVTKRPRDEPMGEGGIKSDEVIECDFKQLPEDPDKTPRKVCGRPPQMLQSPSPAAKKAKPAPKKAKPAPKKKFSPKNEKPLTLDQLRALDCQFRLNKTAAIQALKDESTRLSGKVVLKDHAQEGRIPANEYSLSPEAIKELVMKENPELFLESDDSSSN